MSPALALLLSTGPVAPAHAALYELLVNGGHVIDPKNGVDGRFDVAVANGKIAAIGPDLPEAEATNVVRAAGLLVVPGLVDMHAHVFHGTEPDR
ncbi:MAG TPA: amidohydrolase/deacetylase family metallohydrolase, partial [Polyangia bacterium]